MWQNNASPHQLWYNYHFCWGIFVCLESPDVENNLSGPKLKICPITPPKLSVCSQSQLDRLPLIDPSYHHILLFWRLPIRRVCLLEVQSMCVLKLMNDDKIDPSPKYFVPNLRIMISLLHSIQQCYFLHMFISKIHAYVLKRSPLLSAKKPLQILFSVSPFVC